MTMERVTFNISIKVRSPFLFQGLANALMGIDAAQLRDEGGLPVIPADQVRGVLREAMEDVRKADPTLTSAKEFSDLFGNKSPEVEAEAASGHDRPLRSDLIFADLAAVDAPKDARETTRIEIDLETGAVKTGHLQIIELVAPFGRDVTFTGQLIAFLPAQRVAVLAAALDAALKSVSSIGAFKTAGFGEIVWAEVKLTERTALALPKPPARPLPVRQTYLVTFDRPILVDATWIAENAMEGAAIIPGAVFKGALAAQLARCGEDTEAEAAVLGQALAALRISHAVPADDSGEPAMRPVPLSMVAVKTDKAYQFGDAMAVPYDKGAMIGKAAAVFLTDWKDEVFPLAAKRLGFTGYDEPRRLPRTHTAIGDGGIAEDEKLFTTIARSERHGTGKRSWVVRVDGEDIADTGARDTLLAVLSAGLDGIGKTGARATFQACAQWEEAKAKPVHGTQDQFAIVLQTTALMLDPKLGGEVKAQYEAYFEKACPGATLVNFFASQRLAGRYLATRRRVYGTTYYPFVLTEPGSAFLLRAKDGKALAKQLDKLIRTGLPLPKLTDAAGTLDWRNCPFVPQNGFGEIRADYMSAPNDLWKAVKGA